MSSYDIISSAIATRPVVQTDSTTDLGFSIPSELSALEAALMLVTADITAIETTQLALEQNTNFSNLEKAAIMTTLEMGLNMQWLGIMDTTSKDLNGDVTIDMEGLKETLTKAKNVAINFINKMVDKLKDFYRKFQTSQKTLIKNADDIIKKNFTIVEGNAPYYLFNANGKQITGKAVNDITNTLTRLTGPKDKELDIVFEGLGGTMYRHDTTKFDTTGESNMTITENDDNKSKGFSLKGAKDIEDLTSSLRLMLGAINRIDHRDITKRIYDKLDKSKEHDRLTDLAKMSAKELRFLTVDMPVREAKAINSILNFISANGKA